MKEIEDDSPSTITLKWKDGHTKNIKVMSKIRGISHNGKRPIDFTWKNKENIKVTEKLLKWLINDFADIIDKDFHFRILRFLRRLNDFSNVS